MRIRSIKPEFFKHDGVAALKPLTRLLFIGLWCLADSEGRLEDRPKRIGVEVLPYDDRADIDAMLAELHAAGLIVRYSAGGQSLVQIRAFRKHQRITGKEAAYPSAFPAYVPNASGEAPGKQLGSTGETTGDSPLLHRCPGDGDGDGKGDGDGNGIGDGKETVGKNGRAAEAASTSDEDWLKFLASNPAYQSIDVRREYAKMQAWCQTNAKQPTRRRFVNWLNRCDKPMTTVGQQRTWTPNEEGGF